MIGDFWTWVITAGYLSSAVIISVFIYAARRKR